MIYYKKNAQGVRREPTRARKDDLSVTTAPREHGLLEKTPKTLQLVEVKNNKGSQPKQNLITNLKCFVIYFCTEPVPKSPQWVFMVLYNCMRPDNSRKLGMI